MPHHFRHRLAATRRRSRGEGGGERGSVTVWLLLMVPVVVILAGLVFDGGKAMTAKTEALNVAEQAARAGAGKLDLATLRNGGGFKLDPPAAVAAANGFIGDSGLSGTSNLASVKGFPGIHTSVTWSSSTSFLSIIGIKQFGGTVEANARIAVGVDNEEPLP